MFICICFYFVTKEKCVISETHCQWNVKTDIKVFYLSFFIFPQGLLQCRDSSLYIFPVMRLRCPRVRFLHMTVLHPSFPSGIEMKLKQNIASSILGNKTRHFIKQHIIKMHFQRKITSGILPQTESHFSDTKYNGNYEKAISPLSSWSDWVE